MDGNAGTFDINLPLAGSPGIECRSGGPNGNYLIVFTFANPLTNQPGVTLHGTATLSSAGFGSDQTQFLISLTGVANQQNLQISLTNVNDSAGEHSDSIVVPVGVLIGDVNSSRRVDAADVSFIRQQTLQPITLSNFRADINASGRIDAADVSVARQQTLTSLP